MESYIKSFLSSIQQNTGIEFTVFDFSGKVIFGSLDKTIVVTERFDGVKTDAENSCTIFSFTFKDKDYFGKIDGATKVEFTYATLILELIKSSFSKTNQLSKEEFLTALLHSEITSSDAVKYVKKYRIPTGSCCAMIITTESDVSGVSDVVENYGNESKDFSLPLDETSCVFVKFSDDTTKEYCSFTEYAEYIAQSVYDELGLKVTVYTGGIAKSVLDLGTSFVQASTAVRMAETESHKTQVHSFKEYMLNKILEDLPKYKLEEYLKLLTDPGAEEIFSDEEMIQTAEEFLQNSLNQSETARTLYLHRNTLSYRLDKIEKATGLNIRNFPDAVSFRLITLLHKLVK
ncbi:MAG: helix-turn-helix domain-containing protein [Clostridia bacterium]|nr:helix-turn-helix domain-containing protein [Clostridia bacterium]